MSPEEVRLFRKKVCLVGDPATGKTCLVHRFVIDKYDDSYIQTIGAKVMKKEVQVRDGKKAYDVTMMLWDVMGQKHYRIIESVAFQQIQGVMVVCDVTRKSTLDNVNYWVEAVQRISGKVPVIIMGNKVDLEDLAEFSEKDVVKKAQSIGAAHFMTSAKTGANVEKAFAMLARLSLKWGGQ
jgi:small GTP-binding protein